MERAEKSVIFCLKKLNNWMHCNGMTAFDQNQCLMLYKCATKE